MAITNLFGALALDSTVREIISKISGFSFDTSSGSSLRTSITNTPNIGTVTTVTTANISVGDMGKTSTSMIQTSTAESMGVRRNFA